MDAVEQALVHIHVDHLGAGLDLIAGDGQGGGIVTTSLTSLRKRAEPVTLVRSPILTKSGLTGQNAHAGPSPLRGEGGPRERARQGRADR